jgi:peptidoglycan/LPS O-acetylase OafA/YrhL
MSGGMQAHVENAHVHARIKEIAWMNSARAVAIIVIIVYHMFAPHLSGGFLGVDVLFAMSGYLTTILLVRQGEIDGGINYAGFIKKRFKRLFPAMATMLLVALPLSLLISPDFRVEIRQEVASILGWLPNYYEISTGASYENSLLPHLFVHTWTLGVEMQFYVVF